MADILAVIQQEFNLRAWQAENIARLLEEGNTIPFIARYRKEQTGSVDDQLLREIADRFESLRSLEKRKAEVKSTLAELGALSDELTKAIDEANSLAEVEDIYRPYRPKRKTRASIALEKGLEPLARLLLEQRLMKGDVLELAAAYISDEKGVKTAEEALDGACDIIAEIVSDDAALRKLIRDMMIRDGIVISKTTGNGPSVYDMYADYSEAASSIAPHRILALSRGEKEGFLKVEIEFDESRALFPIFQKFVLADRSITTPYVERAAIDGYRRLMKPSLLREVRAALLDKAGERSIKVFSINLRNLLMQPPLRDKTVMGLDPAYRTGCKIAVVGPTGSVLDVAVVYPTPPQNRTAESEQILSELIKRHNVEVIAIGNGTASRESEIFVTGLIKKLKRPLCYAVVSEAGASVYSASKLAAKEFPQYDVSLRSAISIARRLQDPMAELIKIDPKAIGVGQYQHDIAQGRLSEALNGVVEDCVNSVGVDVNTASQELLSHVASISSAVAKNIVAERERRGRFKSRMQLLEVPRMGKSTFTQCAGFLRVPESDNPLDRTAVHPESYEAAKGILELCGFSLGDIGGPMIRDLPKRVAALGEADVAAEVGVGVPTLRDIVEELMKPGRDPRDSLPTPKLRSDILELSNLVPGMVLDGVVRNVVDFGAFVDLGVHQDGLLHLSEICDRYIRHPSEVLSVGDLIRVKILSVDVDKRRISLTMRSV